MVIQYLFQAFQGKRYWEQLKKKYGPGYAPSQYILFPSADDTYNSWALYYLPEFIKKNHFDKVIVLVAEEDLQNALSNIRHNNLHIIRIRREKMNSLIRLCALVNLTSECTIVSVKEPYDTGAERLLGRKGVTKRDIVWYDIYKMSNIPKKVDISVLSGWVNFDKYQSIITDQSGEKI